MSREEVQKLLGGYATNTLSEAEQQALFAAALEDQELFDALAKEQALRDVLQDPSARQQLLETLGPGREPFRERVWRWLRQPAVLAAAAGLATLLIVAGLMLRQARTPTPQGVLVARLSEAPRLPAAQAPVPQKMTEQPLMGSMPRKEARTAPKAVPAPVPTRQLESAQSRDITVAPKALLTVPTAPKAVAMPSPPALLGGQPRNMITAPSGAPPAPYPAPAQTAPAMMARASARLTAPNPSLPYSLFVRDAAGEYVPTPLDTVFHPGDAIRLHLALHDSGYLYLFQRDPAGNWKLAASQPVEKGERYAIPASGGLQYDEPGRKELLLLLSPQALAEPSPNSQAPGQKAVAITLDYR